MNYPNISKALGWKEEISATEGVFLQPVEISKIEKDLGGANATKSQTGEIAARDKRIKELEAQVATFSKPNGNKVTGKQAGAIDFSFIDKLTGARKRAAENQPG